MIDVTRPDLKSFIKQNPHCIYERSGEDEILLTSVIKTKLSIKKKIKIMKYLLAAGVDINWASPHNRYTALMWACRAVELKCVEFLLESGADPNQVDHEENTSLFWACDTKGTDSVLIIALLLQYGVEVNSKNNSGCTPLIWSSQKDNFEISYFLVEHGANVNCRDNGGNTPLIWACKNGCRQVAYLLLDRGAKVNKRNHVGNTPLMWACIKGDIELVKTLLTMKARINMANEAGWTPLMWACKSGHESIVSMLLEAGAEVDVATKSHETALMWASHQQHLGCVRKLLNANCSVHLRNSAHEDALLYACKRENNDLILLLMAHGANPLLVNTKGMSALKYIFQVGNLGMLEYLLSSKFIHPNLPLETGEYPLYLAVLSRSLPIVKLLVQHHANVNQKNLQEPIQTITSAYYSRRPEIALYLAEEGTDMRNHTQLQQSDERFYSLLVRTWNWGRRKNFLIFLQESGFRQNVFVPLSTPSTLRTFHCFDLCRMVASYL